MFPLEDELMFVLGPQINRFRGTLIITRSKELVSGGDSIIANGGFGLVDTGKKKLLVTCNHVWKKFLDEHKKDSEVRMAVCFHGRSPVIFDKCAPIDQDANLILRHSI